MNMRFLLDTRSVVLYKHAVIEFSVDGGFR